MKKWILGIVTTLTLTGLVGCKVIKFQDTKIKDEFTKSYKQISKKPSMNIEVNFPKADFKSSTEKNIIPSFTGAKIEAETHQNKEKSKASIKGSFSFLKKEVPFEIIQNKKDYYFNLDCISNALAQKCNVSEKNTKQTKILAEIAKAVDGKITGKFITLVETKNLISLILKGKTIQQDPKEISKKLNKFLKNEHANTFSKSGNKITWKVSQKTKLAFIKEMAGNDKLANAKFSKILKNVKRADITLVINKKIGTISSKIDFKFNDDKNSFNLKIDAKITTSDKKIDIALPTVDKILTEEDLMNIIKEVFTNMRQETKKTDEQKKVTETD